MEAVLHVLETMHYDLAYSQQTILILIKTNADLIAQLDPRIVENFMGTFMSSLRELPLDSGSIVKIRHFFFNQQYYEFFICYYQALGFTPENIDLRHAEARRAIIVIFTAKPVLCDSLISMLLLGPFSLPIFPDNLEGVIMFYDVLTGFIQATSQVFDLPLPDNDAAKALQMIASGKKVVIAT